MKGLPTIGLPIQIIKTLYNKNTRRGCLSLPNQGASFKHTFIHLRRGCLSLPIQDTSIHITFIYTRIAYKSKLIQCVQYIEQNPSHSIIIIIIIIHECSSETKPSITTLLHSKHDHNTFIQFTWISFKS